MPAMKLIKVLIPATGGEIELSRVKEIQQK